MNVQNRLRAGRAAPARGSASPGHPGQQGNSGFLLIIALTSKSGAIAALELGNFAKTRVDGRVAPRRRRRRRPVFLFRIRDARLARSRSELASFNLSRPMRLRRCGNRIASPPAAQLGDQPIADGRRAQRDHPDAEPLHARPSSSRPSSCAPIPTGRWCGWATSRASSLARRTMSSTSELQRQADGRHGDPAHHWRQCARDGRRRSRHRMAELARLSAGHRLDRSPTTRRRSSGSRSRR